MLGVALTEVQLSTEEAAMFVGTSSEVPVVQDSSTEPELTKDVIPSWVPVLHNTTVTVVKTETLPSDAVVVATNSCRSDIEWL